MKRILIIMTFVTVAVLNVHSVPVQLWYDDFSTRWNSDGDPNGNLNLFPPASPGIGDIATNSAHADTWYRRATGDGSQVYSTMFSTNGSLAGNGNSLSPPPGSVSGTGMRAGYHGHTDVWQQYADINTGVILSNDINYTLSFCAKLKHRLDATTNLVGEGSVAMGFGFWDTTVVSNNFTWFNAGGNFSNLTSTAWVTNTMTLYGGRMNVKAAGNPLVLRVTKRGPQNTLDFESWLDWIEITGVDPYAEWANSEGLASLDRTADEDLDTVDNFTEWAVGGDPNNPNDKGLPGSGFIWDNDGTNVFSFIIPRQTNWYPNGVNYNFEGNDNLIAASSWTNVYPWDWNPVDSGGYNAEFDAVTNYFSGTNSLVNVDSNETYFIRLRVDHRSYNP